MSKRDPRVALAQMRDHAAEVLALTKGKTRASLEADRVLSLAVVRLFEIVGEAASRVPEEVRSTDSRVAWQGWMGLRNRIIHGYDTVDSGILWRIVETDLPALRSDLDRILAG